LRHADILGGCLWVTRCNHHVTVIPITPLLLTTVRNISGHMALGRVVKRDDSAQAGLALSAEPPAHSRRCHALTFHRFNVLLKTPRNPGGPIGAGGSSRLIAWHAEFIPFLRRLHGA